MWRYINAAGEFIYSGKEESHLCVSYSVAQYQSATIHTWYINMDDFNLELKRININFSVCENILNSGFGLFSDLFISQFMGHVGLKIAS